MKAAKDYVDAFRQYGLDSAGELSVENIVYKIFRNRGIIKLLKDVLDEIFNRI